MLIRMIRKIKVSSDWFGCVLVISFRVATDVLDVVDCNGLVVFLVKSSPAVDGFEVNPPVLHNSPWQQSIVQLETRPPSLSILHAVAQKSKFSINMRTHVIT